MQIREGLHYNPYFPGGAIAMPKMLIDGAIEYEDGTPSTESQVISCFFVWIGCKSSCVGRYSHCSPLLKDEILIWFFCSTNISISCQIVGHSNSMVKRWNISTLMGNH